jgi:hypothetical protein
MEDKCKHLFDRTGKCKKCGENRENIKLKDSGIDLAMAKEIGQK